MVTENYKKDKRKILIVDDEKNLRDVLTTIFELEGYVVSSAEDGYKAIEKVKQEKYDVALIDIKMPGINGIETFKEIKKISPSTIVFMMTACAVEELIQQAMEEKPQKCVNKPFDVEKIITEIKETQQKTLVLVVDSDTGINSVITSMLEKRGYRVVSAISDVEAREIVKDSPFDIILLDVVMSGMNGIETLKKIKEMMGERCPRVFLMSSHDIKQKVEEGIALGAEGFLKKPLNIDELDKSIRHVLQKDKNMPVKILIVDDDATFCNTFSIILKEKQYDVETANTGKEATEKCQMAEWEVIVLDVKLPDTNGMELCQKIKETKPNTEIVMVTGFSHEAEIAESIEKQGIVCLYKPFKPEDLLNLVDGIVARGALGRGVGSRKSV